MRVLSDVLSILIWLAPAVLIIQAAAPITQGLPRRTSETQLDQFARRSTLPLPPELRTAVLARITGQERWAVAGGLIGLVLGVSISLIIGNPDTVSLMIIVLGSTVGVSVGAGLAVLVRPSPLVPDAPRVARTQETGLADYGGPRQWWILRLSAVAALIGFGAALFAGSTSARVAAGSVSWTMIAVGTTAVVLGSWAGTEILCRLLLRRAQRAGSALELAWDDVLRAQAQRRLVQAVIASSLISLLACGFWVLAGVGGVDVADLDRSGFWGSGLVLVVLLAGSGLALVLYYARNPARHVIERLWAGSSFGDVTRGRHRAGR